MADPTPPVKGISLTKKIAPTSTAGVLLGLILYLPQPYAHWLALMVCCLYFISLAATRINAPVEGSKWRIPYKLLCFVSANFGAATNDTPQPTTPTSSQPQQVVIISNSEDVVKATQQALSNKDISIMDTVNSTTTPSTPATPAASTSTQTVATPAQSAPVSTVKKESISNLVSAGENLYETISGKKSDEAVKVISGVSTIIDVLLPAIDAKIDISVEDIIGGTTEVISGIDTVVAAFKKKQA